MKTFATRLEEIGGWLPLRRAWFAYRSGKRRRPEVATFELRADSYLFRLSRDLLDGSYRHGDYRILFINDPKARLIAVAPIRDRIVHTAIYRALSPAFDRLLIDDTYACLEGRGSHRALLRFWEFQHRFRHVMHLDIRRYFPSVDHEILLQLLAPRLRDERVIGLIQEVLGSGWRLYTRPWVRKFFDLPTLAAEPRRQGLPIGNLTSQWWGNLYLSGLDHFAKRTLKAKGYLRYQDDFALFAEDRTTLRRWRGEIIDWLARERRLMLNPHKAHIRPTTLPAMFLGHRVTRSGHDPGPKAMRRFVERLQPKAMEGTTALERSLTAWRGTVFW